MYIENIEQDFQEKVSKKIYITSEGINRYRVFTPFLFDDGDHLAIVLKYEHPHWMLSDEGHTFMHLTYDIDEKDLQRGTRQKIISNTLSVSAYGFSSAALLSAKPVFGIMLPSNKCAERWTGL